MTIFHHKLLTKKVMVLANGWTRPSSMTIFVNLCTRTLSKKLSYWHWMPYDTNTLPTLVGVGHQCTTPTSRGHFWSYLSQWEPLVATSAGTLHSLVASTSRCGEGINIIFRVICNPQLSLARHYRCTLIRPSRTRKWNGEQIFLPNNVIEFFFHDEGESFHCLALRWWNASFYLEELCLCIAFFQGQKVSNIETYMGTVKNLC